MKWIWNIQYVHWIDKIILYQSFIHIYFVVTVVFQDINLNSNSIWLLLILWDALQTIIPWSETACWLLCIDVETYLHYHNPFIFLLETPNVNELFAFGFTTNNYSHISLRSYCYRNNQLCHHITNNVLFQSARWKSFSPCFPVQSQEENLLVFYACMMHRWGHKKLLMLLRIYSLTSVKILYLEKYP